MRFSHFFIDRPIFAAVLAIIITIAGALVERTLPISEYPEIAPPTVSIRATYPGASAEVLAETVATPIEQEVNGVDNMLYITSQSVGDGTLTIDVVFKPGTDVDTAQVLVQNRVSVATPRLPDDVQHLGVTVRKASPDLMMVVHMISPDGSYDQQYISNYATLLHQGRAGTRRWRGRRQRVRRARLLDAGVARPRQGRGARPDRRGRGGGIARGQPPGRGGRHQPAAGDVAGCIPVVGADTRPPARCRAVRRHRRARRPGGTGFVRIRDIARVELGSQDYTVNAYLNKAVATAIVIYQRPGSNALTTAAMSRHHAGGEESFPSGLDYTIVYNPTEFIQQSINEVKHTLLVAILLVVCVVILFLQTWRAAIIPVIAIPVSLIGCFLVMGLVGISFNTLSLFGLVLAIGIVVDDAIVVVENVERYIEKGMPPREAAHLTMDEVGGALIAIALVLCAVFIPTAFISGLQGSFYRQFAVTIAAATVISAFVSLTLSPALAALLLKPRVEAPERTLMYRLGAPCGFFSGFNWAFERLSLGYGRAVARLVRVSAIVLVAYAMLIFAAYNRLASRRPG